MFSKQKAGKMLKYVLCLVSFNKVQIRVRKKPKVLCCLKLDGLMDPKENIRLSTKLQYKKAKGSPVCIYWIY